MNTVKNYQTVNKLLFDQGGNSVVKVWELSGTFGESKGRKLRKEINHSISNGTKTFIVNLKNIDFMESSGLAALVLVHRRIQAIGGKLFLVSISEPVRMLFELTAMDSVFKIIADRTDLKKMFDQTSTKSGDVKEYANASRS